MSLPDRSNGTRSVPTSPIRSLASEPSEWAMAYMDAAPPGSNYRPTGEPVIPFALSTEMHEDGVRYRWFGLPDLNPFPRFHLFRSPRRSTR